MLKRRGPGRPGYDSEPKLVSAARSLLAERGFEATSPQMSQQRSVVGHGSMYHHFPGKGKEGPTLDAISHMRASTIAFIDGNIAPVRTDREQARACVVAALDRLFSRREGQGLARLLTARDQEVDDRAAHRTELESESDKLLAANFADAIDLPTLKRHPNRIRAGLADVNQRFAEHDKHHTTTAEHVSTTACDCSPTPTMPTPDQEAPTGDWQTVFYTRLEITEDEQLHPRLAGPFAPIIREAHHRHRGEGEEAKRKQFAWT